MASPPPKRQRTAARMLKDDDEEVVSWPLSPQKGLGIKNKSRTAAATSARSRSKPKPSPRPSPKSSPEKNKDSAKAKQETEKNQSLHHFFNRATEEQRWNRGKDTPSESRDDSEFPDDIVDDDSLDEAFLELIESKNGENTVLDRRKGLDAPHPPLSSSRRFVKPVLPNTSLATSRRPSADDRSQQPWADRYGPTTLDELAVNKKKVAEVQQWLMNVVAGTNPSRILVLKGPAGSGKTTTITLLSALLRLQVVAWSSPTVSEAGTAATFARQFEEFLNRGSKFSSLIFDGSGEKPQETLIDPRRRVLLVEEFPATMTRSSSGLDTFRSALLQYVASSAPSKSTIFRQTPADVDQYPPVILIVTETLLSSSTAVADSFVAHRLLGPQLLNHPLVTVIEFKAIAPTFMAKALDLVVKKEARDSGRRRAPGPAVLQRLAEIGDVRSAINSLHFLCVRGDSNADWSGTVAAKAKLGSKDGTSLTAMEKESIEVISQRETTLDMFHAVAKVVYNKREDPKVADSRAEPPPPQPPDHLRHLHKPKASQVDIEMLLNETGTDIQTFISALYENYVLSCNGESFVDACDGCARELSDSDVLYPNDRRVSRLSRLSGSGMGQLQLGSTDMLRQDEISFQVATRGLLFALPYPITRAPYPSGRKLDSFKMFYPASLRLWKPTEEMDGLISLFVNNTAFLQSGQQYAAAMRTKKTSIDGVASWQARVGGGNSGFASQSQRENSKENRNDETETTDETVPRRSLTSRSDLPLDFLPYATKILAGRDRGRPRAHSASQAHGRGRNVNSMLSQITKLRGPRAPTSGDEPWDEDEDANEEEGVITERDVGSGTSRGASVSSLDHRASKHGARAQPPQQQRQQGVDVAGSEVGVDLDLDTDVEKLYLSSDDIEDD